MQEIEANKKRLKDLRESKSVLQGECQGTSQEAASIATDSKESVSDICKIQVRFYMTFPSHWKSIMDPSSTWAG